MREPASLGAIATELRAYLASRAARAAGPDALVSPLFRLKQADLSQPDSLIPEPGSFHLMDRGYVD